jgi:hypothetical protein
MDKVKIFDDITDIILKVYSNDPETSRLYAQHELFKYINKLNLPVEAKVMQKTADTKEINMEEILMKSLADMEKKNYMILLKNGKKFEYYDSDYEKTNFDEYTLDEYYNPDRGINIIEMRKDSRFSA